MSRNQTKAPPSKSTRGGAQGDSRHRTRAHYHPEDLTAGKINGGFTVAFFLACTRHGGLFSNINQTFITFS